MGDQIDKIALFGAGPSRLKLARKTHAPIIVDTNCLYRINGERTESIAAKKSGKCLAEICIEGINDRVQGRIGPSEPNENIKSGRTYAKWLCSLG